MHRTKLPYKILTLPSTTVYEKYVPRRFPGINPCTKLYLHYQKYLIDELETYNYTYPGTRTRTKMMRENNKYTTKEHNRLPQSFHSLSVIPSSFHPKHKRIHRKNQLQSILISRKCHIQDTEDLKPKMEDHRFQQSHTQSSIAPIRPSLIGWLSRHSLLNFT